MSSACEAWTTGSGSAGCRPSMARPRCPSGDFRIGSTPIGHGTFRSTSRLQRRWSFLRFVELLFAASGRTFEATAYATRCEVSRTTVANYLQGAGGTRPSRTSSAHTARGAPRRSSPHRGSTASIRASSASSRAGSCCATRIAEHCGSTACSTNTSDAPSGGASPTGATSAAMRWTSSSQGARSRRSQWSGAWSADRLDVRNLRAFRAQYPAGANYVVTADTERSYVRDCRGLRVRFVSLPDLFRYVA